jgi:hypothetical protein
MELLLLLALFCISVFNCFVVSFYVLVLTLQLASGAVKFARK